MSVETENLKVCDGCGASIYPEHLENGSANRLGGKLLCAHCLPQKRAQATGGITATIGTPKEIAFKRALVPDAHYATRCRTFHCRLSEAGFQHMNDQINEWVDGHEGTVIKFATNSIGVIDGKHAEPHLIVTVFY